MHRVQRSLEAILATPKGLLTKLDYTPVELHSEALIRLEGEFILPVTGTSPDSYMFAAIIQFRGGNEILEYGVEADATSDNTFLVSVPDRDPYSTTGGEFGPIEGHTGNLVFGGGLPLDIQPNDTFRLITRTFVDGADGETPLALRATLKIFTSYVIPHDPGDDTAPQVTNVAISGSGSPDPAYSFAGHVGLGALQLTPAPVRDADSITISFSEPVYAGLDDLTLVNRGTNDKLHPTSVSYDGDDVTWTFDSPLDPAQYQIALSDMVTDDNFNSLDGEWASNPTSLVDTGTDTFPSGDGTAGGNFQFNFAIDTPPQVQDVTFSSSVTNPYGTNPAYDFYSNVGTGAQLKTVPVGGADTIAIKFSKAVMDDPTATSPSLSAGDLQIIALNRVVTEPTTSLIQNPDSTNGYTAVWRLSGTLPAAQYELRLKDTIKDAAGSKLDGEWTNPVSISSTGSKTFPSGNGVAGGDFKFVFVYMPGDLNRDGVVDDDNDHDVAIANYTATHATWANGDTSGNGVVGTEDFGWTTITYGADWSAIPILGDYDHNHVLDGGDEATFSYDYTHSLSGADLNQSAIVTSADYDAFYALYNFEGSGAGIHLNFV